MFSAPVVSILLLVALAGSFREAAADPARTFARIEAELWRRWRGDSEPEANLQLVERLADSKAGSCCKPSHDQHFSQVAARSFLQIGQLASELHMCGSTGSGLFRSSRTRFAGYPKMLSLVDAFGLKHAQFCEHHYGHLLIDYIHERLPQGQLRRPFGQTLEEIGQQILGGRRPEIFFAKAIETGEPNINLFMEALEHDPTLDVVPVIARGARELGGPEYADYVTNYSPQALAMDIVSSTVLALFGENCHVFDDRLGWEFFVPASLDAAVLNRNFRPPPARHGPSTSSSGRESQHQIELELVEFYRYSFIRRICQLYILPNLTDLIQDVKRFELNLTGDIRDVHMVGLLNAPSTSGG